MQRKRVCKKEKKKKRTRGTTSLVFGVGHEKPRFGRFEFERGVAFPYRDPLGVLRADALRFRLTFVERMFLLERGARGHVCRGQTKGW